jgi:APA family basic amino acid/polyamine antiporter
MSKKQIGLAGTLAIGLASMLGAGVFVVFRDAYQFAGAWLYAALGLAALVASLNAASIYQLARQVDRPGGTYAYARVYRSETWSFVAGFAFVFGKIGSIAAIALVFGEYAWPDQKHLAAVAAILVMVIVNVLGIQRTASVAAVLSIITTAFLVFAIAAGSSPFAGMPRQVATYVANSIELPTLPGWGIVTGASLIFFAFAGYARVATLGNEVRNAKRNIPRAIALSLGAVLVLYLALTAVLTKVLGSDLASAEAPFIAYFNALGLRLDWLVLVVASLASLGSILALLAGVSRTAAEMSSDRELPKIFEARNRFGSPWVAEVLIAVGASSLVFVGDLSSVIGFSSFSVLFYYAVSHLSALGLPAQHRLLPRALAVTGLALCLLLAVSVPGPAVAVSTAILLAAVVTRRILRVDSR